MAESKLMDLLHLIMIALAAHSLTHIWFTQPLMQWPRSQLMLRELNGQQTGGKQRLGFWAAYASMCTYCMSLYMTAMAILCWYYAPFILYLFAGHSAVSLYREVFLEMLVEPRLKRIREGERRKAA
jgi:hypothetical protein